MCDSCNQSNCQSNFIELFDRIWDMGEKKGKTGQNEERNELFACKWEKKIKIKVPKNIWIVDMSIAFHWQNYQITEMLPKCIEFRINWKLSALPIFRTFVCRVQTISESLFTFSNQLGHFSIYGFFGLVIFHVAPVLIDAREMVKYIEDET